jgi:LmbE family N-acetylglucosaminyl deacetylase
MTKPGPDRPRPEPWRAGAGPVLFVSPHLDDAVLSAGGLLATLAGESVRTLVLTPFAGTCAGPWSRFAQEFHAACGLPDEEAATIRRTEDRSALTALAAGAWHGDLLDAIYRRGPDGGWLYDGAGRTFGPPDPGDRATAGALAELVERAVTRLRPRLLVGPAALGDHVDHVFVRDAMIATSRRDGTPVLLWEDQPYALRQPPPADWCPAVPAAARLELSIPDRRWKQRISALGCYHSQLRMLFGPDSDWRLELTRYATGAAGRSRAVERYWTVG